MDNNEEKKPKRPRIGENRIAASSDGENNFSSKVDHGQQGDYHSPENGHREYNSYDRPYQPRPYNNRQQGGYNNRYNNQGGYNNNRQQGGYNNRYNNQGGYQPRQYQPQQGVEGAENTADQSAEGYAPSSQPEGYNAYRPSGYNNNRQGGYNNRQQGGYNNNRQGGYNNRQQGGYNNNRQGGYNNRQQGGYNNRQQGGYNNNRQGGYNNNRQQGGYNNNRPQGGNRGFNAPRQGKSFVPRPKRIEYEMPIPDPNEQIRLNKFMANAGICSRREADEFITAGVVSVNGEVVTELGTKIKRGDEVKFHDQTVSIERKIYVLLNKPKDTVTTSDDPQARRTVMDLVKGACNERIYPVGRLDRNTTGVLLLTNDGDLASKLTHPKYLKKKIYHVHLDKNLTKADMEQIAAGIQLDDGEIRADAISYTDDFKKDDVGIEIHSGKNRIVRRIFESLGYKVMKLDRVYFAGLTKKGLRRGEWRYLTEQEVNFLRMGSFE